MHTESTSKTFVPHHCYKFSLFFLIISFLPTSAVFAEDQSRLYSTREERREAGVRHEITPWLIVAGLAEFEWEWKKYRLKDFDDSDYLNNKSAAVQIGFDVIPAEWALIEIITEYDTDANELFLDEATIALEHNSWELIIGKQALDFGVYYSHFASGPILEFGETSDYAVTLAYSHNDIVDVSASVFKGEAHKFNAGSNIDWSVALETWITDYFSVGASYLSDLAEADSGLLDDFNDHYQKRVAGLSGYLLWVGDTYEVSLEGLGAVDDFRELESDRNQPIAWNLEFTHYTTPKFDWSLRLENTYEIEDEPEIQFGLALNYRLHENVVLTAEILHGLYRNNLATDDHDNEFDNVTSVGALLSVAF